MAKPPDAHISLRDLASKLSFHIGAAVNTKALSADPVYAEVLAREFNLCVAENAFKFAHTQPTPGAFNFTDTDMLVSFAESHGMKLRGHTLVWHQALPSWLTAAHLSRAEALRILREHITTLVSRYRGRIWAWDVVNEAVSDNSGGLRTDSFWYQTIGPDYIAMAFRFAHEADPTAVLYYNDYNAEDLQAKSDAVYLLVCDLKQQEVPVHGVGWQCHVTEGWRVSAEIEKNARRLSDLGVEISVTEFDLRLRLPANEKSYRSQAVSYADMLEFCLRQNVRAFLSWGFTDLYSWIPGWQPGWGDALIFDSQYRPKPAYHALREVLERAASRRSIAS